MNDYNIPKDKSFIDEIVFGLYVRDSGCISETTIVWKNLMGKPVFYIRSFGDGLKVSKVFKNGAKMV